MTAPVRSDIAAKQALDRLSRAAREQDGALALEAAAMITELVRAGYALLALADPSEVAARAVKLKARHEGACVLCCAPIAVGDSIWWTRGAQGIECDECGKPEERC